MFSRKKTVFGIPKLRNCIYFCQHERGTLIILCGYCYVMVICVVWSRLHMATVNCKVKLNFVWLIQNLQFWFFFNVAGKRFVLQAYFCNFSLQLNLPRKCLVLSSGTTTMNCTKFAKIISTAQILMANQHQNAYLRSHKSDTSSPKRL